MKCKNCGAEVSGKFCSHCGQSSKVNRIDFPNFLAELSGSVFQIHRGFFFTIKELFLRPGFAIRDYLDGKRKNHFKPVAYALTLSTLFYLISRWTGGETFIGNFVIGFTNRPGDVGEQAAVLQWFADHYAYGVLLLIPIYALASFIAFYGSRVNYLEHIVLNCYIIGHQTIFYLVASLFELVSEDVATIMLSITLLLSVFYSFWTFSQFFSTLKKGFLVLRFLISYPLSFFFLTVLLFLIFSVTKLF